VVDTGGADVALYGVDIAVSSDDADSIGMPSRLGQKSLPYLIQEPASLCFHPVQFPANSLARGVHGHVQHEGQIRGHPVGGDLAYGPDVSRIEPARVTLVRHVRQQKPIGNHGPARPQCRSDDFLHQLSACSHVEQHFAAPSHRLVVAVQQQATN